MNSLLHWRKVPPPLVHLDLTAIGPALGQALLLRGGDAAIHAALVSCSTNALGLVLYCVAKEALALRRDSRQRRELNQWERAAETTICGFAAFMLVYFICGFVPMGYVDGARPLIRLPTTSS